MELRAERFVVQYYGETAQRRVYAVDIGRTPVLEPGQLLALSTYIRIVGQPPIAMNAPEVLHI